jgi:hypothetical protein
LYFCVVSQHHDLPRFQSQPNSPDHPALCLAQ